MARGSCKPAGVTVDGRRRFTLRWNIATPTGARRQRQERWTTPAPCDARAGLRQATQVLAERVAKAERGELAASTDTLAVYLASWLDAIASSIAPHTIYSYRGIVTRRIVPVLGGRRLDRLTVMDAERLIAEQLRHGLKPSTARLTHTILNRALTDAVRWGLLPRNPVAGAHLPKTAPPMRSHWTAEEARAFLDHSAGDDLIALWRLALDGGLRVGELLALVWSDLDLTAATVTVGRTVTRTVAGLMTIGDTAKTRAGHRRVDLAPSTVDALVAHRSRQAAARLSTGLRPTPDLVFCGPDGGLLRRGLVGHRLSALAVAAGVPRLTPHGLRRTSTTLLILAGVNPKIVSERLGHTRTSMTMDLYTVLTPGLQREAARRMEDLFGPNGAPSVRERQPTG